MHTYFILFLETHHTSPHLFYVELDKLIVTDPTPFAERDFLNMFFHDVYKPIPNMYNLVLAMLWRHPENIELDKVKVVHYWAVLHIFLDRCYRVYNFDHRDRF
jgi:inositol 3-alpha-galactosyltransferase